MGKASARPRASGAAKVERWHEPRQYPRQLVVPVTEDTKVYVEQRRLDENVSQAVVSRELLDSGRRVADHAAKTGWSVEQLLAQLEKVPARPVERV